MSLFGLKEKEEAKERKLSRDRGGKFTPTVEHARSKDKLGAKAKVSERTYSKGIKIKENNPELWQILAEAKLGELLINLPRKPEPSTKGKFGGSKQILPNGVNWKESHINSYERR